MGCLFLIEYFLLLDIVSQEIGHSEEVSWFELLIHGYDLVAEGLLVRVHGTS